MSRPHRTDASGNRVRTVRLSARIPEHLMLELRVLCCNPATGKMRYGHWGATLEHILREWINSQKTSALLPVHRVVDPFTESGRTKR